MYADVGAHRPLHTLITRLIKQPFGNNHVIHVRVLNIAMLLCMLTKKSLMEVILTPVSLEMVHTQAAKCDFLKRVALSFKLSVLKKKSYMDAI